MKNLERDRRRKKGAIGSQGGGFRTFERRTGHADGRSATCILEGGADVTVYSVWTSGPRPLGPSDLRCQGLKVPGT